MTSRILHLSLLVLATAGLAAGILAHQYGAAELADLIWAGATIPVIAMLAVFIVVDFLAGKVGVDAIALLSMTVAIILGEPLAGVVVAIMYSGGNVLEHFARSRAELNLKALADRTPRSARRVCDGDVVEIPVGEVRIGDELLVQAGEVIPVDGELTVEHAVIDMAALTGEPIPVTLRRGDMLASGTVNAGEALRMRATALADQSTYAGIVRMVEAAHTARAPFIRMADRFAILLLPVAVAMAGAAWLLSGDPVRALAVLVVATPCPLILAAPVALIAGVSRAAHAGIVMKGAGPLEALARVRTAIFDKTGTLTQGGAQISAIRTAPGIDPDEVLRLAASLELASSHVVADAIIAAARGAGLGLEEPEKIREVRGAGIDGTVSGRRLRVGGASLVLADGSLPDWARAADSQDAAGVGLTVFVSIDGDLAGVLLMRDDLRPETPETLARLASDGIGRVVMLTGDEEAAAQAVGNGLGFDVILAGCTPVQKVEFVLSETARAPTMMVGDGINDAPALAAATVGIAMGARGATASSEAADIVVLVERLDRVADGLEIARRSRSIAMQSIVIGLALSGIAMVAAAFGYIGPVAGALLQEAIDVAVIVNALRALAGPRHQRRAGKSATCNTKRAAT